MTTTTTPPATPTWTRIAGLYRRCSRAGHVYYVGKVADGRRVYLFPNTDRRPKDGQPSYWLCVRADVPIPHTHEETRNP